MPIDVLPFNIKAKMNKGIKKPGKVVLCSFVVLMMNGPTPQLEMTFVGASGKCPLARSGAGMLFIAF